METKDSSFDNLTLKEKILAIFLFIPVHLFTVGIVVRLLLDPKKREEWQARAACNSNKSNVADRQEYLYLKEEREDKVSIGARIFYQVLWFPVTLISWVWSFTAWREAKKVR